MDNRISEIKDTMLEFIININNRIDDISDVYKLNGDVDNERILNLLEDLQSLAEGMDIIKDYYKGIDLLELHEKLETMVNVLEDNDYPMFIDVMGYELKDLLVFWTNCMG